MALSRTTLPTLLVTLLVLPLAVIPPAAADHAYEQPVWFRWNTTQLDVLVVGVEDPLLGRAIRLAAERWTAGIQELAPAWLAESFQIRMYLSGLDALPPQGFQAHDVEIYVFPQGFFAVQPGINGASGPICTAHAPMITSNTYAVAAHELGHCLGLGHVFNHGNEYSPAFDIMGQGSVAGGACPSNLNIQVLQRVYGHLHGQPSGGTITMSASDYVQSDCR